MVPVLGCNDTIQPPDKDLSGCQAASTLVHFPSDDAGALLSWCVCLMNCVSVPGGFAASLVIVRNVVAERKRSHWLDPLLISFFCEPRTSLAQHSDRDHEGWRG